MYDYHRARGNQLDSTPLARPWIWDGYVAPGLVTLLISVWKSGKTTLLAHLLAQRKNGGVLGGRAVTAGVSAVVSEEDQTRWHERGQQLGFHPADSFFCRPFPGTPTKAQWSDFLDFLASLKAADGVDLVILDPVSRFLPEHEENHAKAILEALTALGKLTEQGMAVVLVHHPRKAAAPLAMSARGSGMLPAAADVVMEMFPARPDDPTDRRRRLLAYSRDARTPRSLLVELDAAGTLLTAIDEAEEELQSMWPPLREVLESARRELTCKEIHAELEPKSGRPSEATLRRWLEHARERGWVLQTGAGKRTDPVRWFLPEKLLAWQSDPLYQMAQQMRAEQDTLLPSLGYDMGGFGDRP